AELLRLCAGHPLQSHAAADGFMAAFELLQHEALGSEAVLDLVAACRQAPVSSKPVVPDGDQATPGIAAPTNAVREADDEKLADILARQPSSAPSPGPC
ncbi:hypothetical protein, partial [Limimaricola cinnabarinus]